MKPPESDRGGGRGQPGAHRLDQKSGAVWVMVTSGPPEAPLHVGEAAQGSPGPRGVASAAPENWAAMPGVPVGATQGGMEPRECRDLLGGPQPHPGEGQPTAQEGRATAPP